MLETVLLLSNITYQLLWLYFAYRFVFAIFPFFKRYRQPYPVFTEEDLKDEKNKELLRSAKLYLRLLNFGIEFMSYRLNVSRATDFGKNWEDWMEKNELILLSVATWFKDLMIYPQQPSPLFQFINSYITCFMTSILSEKIKQCTGSMFETTPKQHQSKTQFPPQPPMFYGPRPPMFYSPQSDFVPPPNCYSTQPPIHKSQSDEIHNESVNSSVEVNFNNEKLHMDEFSQNEFILTGESIDLDDTELNATSHPIGESNVGARLLNRSSPRDARMRGVNNRNYSTDESISSARPLSEAFNETGFSREQRQRAFFNMLRNRN